MSATKFAALPADAITQMAVDNATEVQLAALAKMLGMGWKVTKVLGTKGNLNIALGTKGQGVWLLPTGKVERPAAGRKCAILR